MVMLPGFSISILHKYDYNLHTGGVDDAEPHFNST